MIKTITFRKLRPGSAGEDEYNEILNNKNLHNIYLTIFSKYYIIKYGY